MLINPATDKPFKEVRPNDEMMQLRQTIMKKLRHKYDAAQDTSQNQLHWAQADALSPNSSNAAAVRKVLRNRSRYETANNGYLKGIILSLCQDFVGSGPTLQINDPRFNDQQRQTIERKWKRRAKKIRMRKSLWKMRHAKCQDGEGFMFRYMDDKLKHTLKSNYRVYEADQITHFDAPLIKKESKNLEVDGIRYDRRSGRPTHYHVLNEHPGDTVTFNRAPLKGTWVPAEQMIHWFRQDRGWHRGIPETSPTLHLWALLRRYTLAVVQNAEIAADFTVLLKSLQPATTNPFSLDGQGQPTQTSSEDWFDSFPVDRGLMTVLPDKYDLTQLDPKQPVSMYDAFVMSLVQEAARPMLVPKMHAVGSSGDFNMASANLDRQTYRQSINDERLDCNEEVLDPDFEDWWFQAVRTPGYFQDEVSGDSVMSTVNRFQDLRDDTPDNTYRWDEVPEHVDPVRVAEAIDILHRGGHISDTDIQEGRFNRRVEDHYENLERQQTWREANDASLFEPPPEPSLPPEDEGDNLKE